MQPSKRKFDEENSKLLFLFAMDIVPFVPNRTPTQKKGIFLKKQSEHVGLAQQNGFGQPSILAQDDAEASLTPAVDWLGSLIGLVGGVLLLVISAASLQSQL